MALSSSLSSTERAETLMAEARALIHKQTPYLMSLVYSFIPREAPELQTMGITKGLVLYYGPEWLLKCTPEQVAAALVHECLHILRDHLPRIAACADKEKGNVAADLAINPAVEEMKYKLPHGVFPKDFKLPNELTLGEYYDKIPASAMDKMRQGQGQGQGQGTPGKGPPGQGQGMGIGSGSCGGIAGNADDQEFEDALDQELGGKTETEVKAARNKTIDSIKKWAEAKGRGNMPGSFQQFIDMDLNEAAHVPWQQVLKSVLKRCCGRLESGGQDFSRTHPSKRSYARGMIIPGMVDYQPEVAFILDTSGSMSDKDIQECLREAIGVLKSLNIETAWLLQADMSVATAPKKVRVKDIKAGLTIHGRGGTDFDDAFRKVDRLKPRPDLVIYLTDGDGGVTYQPKMEVIWCLVSNHRTTAPASWGYPVFVRQDEHGR